jgi:hypothetical protein
MTYTLPFDKFIPLVRDNELKRQLRTVKLKDNAFFSESVWNTSTRVSFNIKAKTSEANIKLLESVFSVKSVGINLDVKGINGSIRFIKSSKKSGTTNRNALGKKLANAGELATVQSLLTEVNTPKDTKQKMFIDDVDSFMAWQNTFKYTKVAVKSIIPNLSSFDIIHDATDNSGFTKTINAFCSKVKIKKDSWNPADIFVVHKRYRREIENTLSDIVNNYDLKSGLIDVFNSKIYSYYKQKQLYPISLKQLANDKPSIDYTNIPGRSNIAAYDIEISNFNCSITGDAKEIGLFTFKNNDTKKNITMQVRGFPHGYTTAQTEIPTDGTPTGGRLGKIPTGVVDRVLSTYKGGRIDSIKFFGRSPNVFSEFTDTRIRETYSWYTEVIKHRLVRTSDPKLTIDDYKDLIENAKNNYASAEILCQKIQGLKIMHFLITNESNIAPIMNKLINGAKKISTDNGFFIKIY